MATSDPSPILIVGAGPTGMLLAIWLRTFDVPFRILEKAPRRPITSRAMIMHARSLEHYRQLGIVDQVLACGAPVKGLRFSHSRNPLFCVEFGNAGTGLGHHPFILSLPQDVHETHLEKHLAQLGVKIERGVEVIGCTQDSAKDHVEVRVRHPSGEEETVHATYVAGCDGAHSAIRTSSSVSFEGGTYTRPFYVADVEMGGELVIPDYANNCLTGDDFTLLIPLPHGGGVRVIGMVTESKRKKVDLNFDDVKESVLRNCNVKIDQVNWFSHYRVHHRVVSSFRDGRLFLAGDAAHLHSPAGGQGMNTGLGDATNLAWKLAVAYHHRRSSRGNPKLEWVDIEKLLDSYTTERIAFARTLVKTTDYAFSLLSGNSWKSYIFRNMFLPYLVPALLLMTDFPRFIFKRVSQITIKYRDSPLSEKLGTLPDEAVHPGDRLPYLPEVTKRDSPQVEDNHASLSPARWRVHVYGSISSAQQQIIETQNLELVVYRWTDVAKHIGLIQNAIYVLRPDSYIGLILLTNSVKENEIENTLMNYCRKWGVKVEM